MKADLRFVRKLLYSLRYYLVFLFNGISTFVGYLTLFGMLEHFNTIV